ncbi:MAG: ATP synthase F0 subunit B [Desulfomonilaceae bacterium]|nr:ATP synthase F0 subunit B [Desulfomonilaceae bacterium]
MKARHTALVFLLLLPMVLVMAGAACAAGDGESQWTAWKISWRVVNTIALIALLMYFLKKPLVNFFYERTAQIRKDLEDAREQREKAEALIADYKVKIAGMEEELGKMRAELKKSAESDSEKVRINAERMAAAIVESARITADQEVRKAKAALKTEAVGLAMEMAETLIREKISEDDRERIIEDYLVKVGGMK